MSFSRMWMWLLLLLLSSTCFGQCGSAATKVFISNTAGSLTGSHTLITTSGTESTTTTQATKNLTSTWFQAQPGVTTNTSGSDSSTPNAKGWIADATSPNAGCSIPAGSWTFSSHISASSGTQTNAIQSVHIYTVNAGVFSAELCANTGTVASFSTTAAIGTITIACPQINFVSGTRLFFNFYLRSGVTNSGNSSTGTAHGIWEGGSVDFLQYPQDITTPSTKHTLTTLGAGPSL